VLLTATGSAQAAPADVCAALIGPARAACHAAKSISGGVSNAASVASDPVGYVAQHAAEAASWVLGKLAAVVTATTQVDFADPRFLRQYAVVFGAATFLTLGLWLVAVAKRAARGVPVAQAVGEAVGFLWLAVVASAFTPLLLALVVRLTDTLTTALLFGTQANTTRFLTGTGKLLAPDLGGGPFLLLVVSLLALAAAAIIWLELLIRGALLYVGAILGCAVYAGLVDKDLWRHVRRWAGVMAAVDLAKPVIVIVLGLAAATTAAGSSRDHFSSVLTGLAVMFLSVFASVAIYRFVPTFGDDMSHLHANRKAAASAGPAAAVDGPVAYMRRGIATHGTRSGSAASAATTGPAAAATVAAGIAAHGVSGGARTAADRARTLPAPRDAKGARS
jgi:hypothetical protein